MDRPGLAELGVRIVEGLSPHVENVPERLIARQGRRSAPPVLITSAPRTSPSVGAIAIARTRPPPRCWAVSARTVFDSRHLLRS